MSWAPLTSTRRLGALTGIALLALMAIAIAAPAASADNVERLAKQLAADTDRLADARAERAELIAAQKRDRVAYRRLRASIEGRLVAIYKHGNTAEVIANLAAGGSMREFGTSIDAIDVVSEQEAKNVEKFVKVAARLKQYSKRRAAAARAILNAEKRVVKSRAKLARAEQLAADAREDAAKMAAIQESPILPRVGHPETTAVAAAIEAAPSSSGQPIGFRQSGVASMYSDSFTGELTANGERYNPNAYTAAHPSLPFGTWVNVTWAGGSVAVRINDRGPFVGGRIIDLSRAAANAIGLPGIAQVTISVSA